MERRVAWHTDDETLRRAADVVREVLHEQFTGVSFEKVSVTTEVAAEDDVFLWFRAVYDGEPKDIDSQVSLSLFRVLTPRLEEIGVDTPHVVSYLAKSDLTKKSLDAL